MGTTQRKKNKIYCSNCGKTGHKYINCKDPITSFGIIMIGIFPFDNQINNHFMYELDENTEIINCPVLYRNEQDLQNFCYWKDRIKFLMIRRRHTLGYIEFIRGRYIEQNVDGIRFLFEQMTPEEIDLISKNDFDVLWQGLWEHDPNKMNCITDTKNRHYREYCESKRIFNKLKNGKNQYGDFLPLSFYTDEIKSTYTHAEWCFPKGRRGYGETDLQCAIREFTEESGYDKSEYKILHNVKPLTEEFFGTNGIFYRHVYYLAISKTDRPVKIDYNNSHQANEIGDIGWLTYEQAYPLIRPHHTQRQNILYKIYSFGLNSIFNKIEKINKNKETEENKE